MKIVIIGGTGLIGSKTVERLRARGHEVVAASPDTGVNTITGEGVAAALEGAEVVIDLANSPSFEDQAVLDFFGTSGRNLLAAEKVAGVKHHVALSVVGTERLQESGYFRGKLLQEKLIKDSAIPYTIVHSTQFMEFLGGIVQSGTSGTTVHLSPAFVQPIASDDVADVMAEVALSASRERNHRDRRTGAFAPQRARRALPQGHERQPDRHGGCGSQVLRRPSRRSVAGVERQSEARTDHLRRVVQDLRPSLTAALPS